MDTVLSSRVPLSFIFFIIIINHLNHHNLRNPGSDNENKHASPIRWIRPSDIDYKSLSNGTLYLVLRHRFEKRIQNHAPDFKTDFQKKINRLNKEKQSLQGKRNQ